MSLLIPWESFYLIVLLIVANTWYLWLGISGILVYQAIKAWEENDMKSVTILGTITLVLLGITGTATWLFWGVTG